MSKVVELFGISTSTVQKIDWSQVVKDSWCPFLDRLCLKARKSSPSILIGTCTASSGREKRSVMICPHRLLERLQIFTDCLHLLTLHEPGNEIHIVPQIQIPGGSVDYFVASVRKRKVKDFVGVELQTVDTTGTVWPERQRFLKEMGLHVAKKDAESRKTFNMNWKMTAKTVLMQLHHKVETFEGINKHLVLVVQNWLIDDMRKKFAFSHIKEARLGDSMHIHSYQLESVDGNWRLQLAGRFSTDTAGVALSLGQQATAKVELETIVELLEGKISDSTLFNFAHPVSDVTPVTPPS